MTFLTPLKPEKKELDYRRVMTLDIETKDGLLGTEFFCASVSYVRAGKIHSKLFKDYDEFMKYLVSLKGKKMIFVHNLSFDGRFILNWLHKHNIKFDVIPYSRGILAIRFNNIVIKDSFALFPLAQDKLLKAFGLKTKVKVDFDKIDYDNPVHQQLVYERNLYDTKSLLEVLIIINKQFFKLFKINPLRYLTLSQVAIRIFRTHFLNVDIQNPYIFDKRGKRYFRKEIYDFVRESYAGGRVEVFDFRDKFHMRYYDFNSLYPSVMRDGKIPLKHFIYEENLSIEEFLEILEKYEGFAEIDVRVYENVKYPILWKKHKGRLIFPVGYFSGVYPFPEIRLFLKYKQGEILRVKRVFYAVKSERIFKDYVDKLYNMRKKMKTEGNPFQLVVKLLLNSLYGKFGQRLEKLDYKIVDSISEIVELEEKGYEQLGENNIYVKKIEKIPSNFQIIHIASYITSLARCKLIETILELDKKGYEVVYCDTDSIVTNARIKDSDELGELKLEHKVFYFKAYAPKVYVLIDEDDKIYFKAKGVDKQLLKNCKSKRDFERLIFNPLTIEKYANFRETLRGNKNIIKKDVFLAYKRLTKQFKFEYVKREVLEDGTTKPIFLHELEVVENVIYDISDIAQSIKLREVEDPLKINEYDYYSQEEIADALFTYSEELDKKDMWNKIKSLEMSY